MPARKTDRSAVVTTKDIKTVEPVEEGYTRVRSPLGTESIVPDAIIDSLLEAGYAKV